MSGVDGVRTALMLVLGAGRIATTTTTTDVSDLMSMAVTLAARRGTSHESHIVDSENGGALTMV
jgi:hypothetical protein